MVVCAVAHTTISCQGVSPSAISSARNARIASAVVSGGTDVVIDATPDLFEPLRDTLRSERMRTGTLVPAASFLPAVTSDSARAIGVDAGTLAVGGRADVILLDGLSHLVGSGTVAGAVVTALGPTNVRTVLVDGRVVKRDGRLVDHDLAALRAAGDVVARRALA